MLTRLVPRLDVKKTALFVCDMQEKFSKTNKFFTEVTQTAKRVIDTANILDIPIIVTEHYPKGLGPTVPELGLGEKVTRHPKTQFSMCIPEVVQSLEGKESVILVGLEAHVCILHTTYALIERGIDVNVVVDAVTARTLVDRKYGFKQLEQVGAVLTTSECVILRLVKDAAHPNFKEIQKIITPGIPDSSLMDMSLRISRFMECGREECLNPDALPRTSRSNPSVIENLLNRTPAFNKFVEKAETNEKSALLEGMPYGVQYVERGLDKAQSGVKYLSGRRSHPKEAMSHTRRKFKLVGDPWQQ